MEKRFSLPEFGYEVVLGKFAQQAAGAAWLKQGGSIVLSAVATAEPKEFPGFFPLTVDYRELFSAAGRIPGGYFKREGKPSDKEVLSGRLIDRAIRPLFPDAYFNQVQVTANVYSVDQEHAPQVLALTATSIALTISGIPFMGPVAAIEVISLDGKLIVNPAYPQSLQAQARIVVAGNREGICMVEGSSQGMSEAQFLDALFLGHEAIKKIVAWQEEITAALAPEKDAINPVYDWSVWQNSCEAILTDDQVARLFKADKVERGTVQDELLNKFLDQHAEAIAAGTALKGVLTYAFDAVLQERITERIFQVRHRLDGRGFDVVRPINVEVGLLPFAHGSSVFTRGRTQALASATLGGGQDELRTEDIMGDPVDGAFMLHYNFPSFSVGEVRPNRGPGRREVGHGHLAGAALKAVVPSKEKFPYTIRVVVDILESDGSSSMASVCSGLMALMNAGVPVSTMVAGVAMGLLRNKQGDFKVLTDIAGIEDAFGLMDFKVAGGEHGITAIQMDIKHKGGLTRDVFERALEQARAGRLHILGEMRKVMTSPNKELSPLVPRIVSFKVPTDKIGAIIGTGGKVIREIIDKTGTQIDIEDDGLVKIYGQPGEKLDQAVGWVKVLGGQIEKGARYNGRITRIAEFGLFVELVPGKDGLVHISAIPRSSQDAFMKSMKMNDRIMVEVVDYDKETDRIRLKPLETPA